MTYCKSSPALLGAGKPGVAAFGRRGAQTFAELFEVVGQREPRDVFHALVSELPGNAHAKRSAMSDRKLAAIHFVCQQRLRMQRIGHVDALPPVRLDRTVDDVTHLRSEEHTSEEEIGR